jgi:hypothetical protein
MMAYDNMSAAALDIRGQELARGLFEINPGSMRCKPSPYLDTAKIRDLGDVYGAIERDSYVPCTAAGLVMIGFRDKRQPPVSRMPRAMTHAIAFKASISPMPKGL